MTAGLLEPTREQLQGSRAGVDRGAPETTSFHNQPFSSLESMVLCIAPSASFNAGRIAAPQCCIFWSGLLC
mgnify:CR=1 FL=1